jgi:hypothetical protein
MGLVNGSARQSSKAAECTALQRLAPPRRRVQSGEAFGVRRIPPLSLPPLIGSL